MKRIASAWVVLSMCPLGVTASPVAIDDAGQQTELAASGNLSPNPFSLPDCLVVVDRSGKPLGTVVDLDHGNGFEVFGCRIILQFQNRPLMLHVNTRTFDDAVTGAVYYESSNCSGPGYLYGDDPDHDTLLSYALVRTNANNELWAQRPGSTEIFFTMHSYGVGDLCVKADTSAYFLPADKLADLSRYFTPPFRIEGGHCQKSE